MAVNNILILVTIFTILKCSTSQIFAPVMQFQQPSKQPTFIFPKLYSPITTAEPSNSLLNQNMFIPIENIKPIESNPLSVVENHKHTKPNDLDNEVLNNVALALQLLLVKNLLKSTHPHHCLEKEEELSTALMESSYPLTAKTRILDSNFPIATASNPLQALTQMLSPPISSSAVKSGSNSPLYTKFTPSASQSYTTPLTQQYSTDSSIFPPCFTASSVLDNYPMQSSTSMPNANFVGSSNFVDSFPSLNMAGLDLAKPSMSPKRSYNLMSPYDAFGDSSEPLLRSPYDYASAKTADPFAQYLGAGNLF